MNLSQYFNMFYSDLGEPDTNRFSIALLKEWIYKAQKYINGITFSIRGSSTVNLVSGQRLYDYPSDIAVNIIDDVYASTAVDPTNNMRLLDRDNKYNLSFNYCNWETLTGTPEKWYQDYEANKLALIYIPSYNSTNGLNILYRKDVTKMSNYYVTGTVTVTNGSAIVTGLSTSFVGNVSVGDKFGVGSLLSSTVAFPTTFYTVLSVDNATQLTLSAVYTGVSGGTLNYITCSDSSITNEEINNACLEYVKGSAKFKDKEYQMDTSLKQFAEFRALQEARKIGSIPLRKENLKVLESSTNYTNLYDYGKR